jgi:hypothetical protein
MNKVGGSVEENGMPGVIRWCKILFAESLFLARTP